MNGVNVKDALSKINNWLSSYASRFPEPIDTIAEIERDFLVELQRIDDDDQCLSIGIMGQVKAGKSSFLNALLFDGKPILPEAATPKTANLTRICYGEQPHLVVHYYSPEEWAAFAREAAGDGDSVRSRVARDLVGMVRSNGIDDVEAILARQQDSFPAAGIDELMNRLNDYVGENGRYTALVKFTEIRLPLDELKGFEIIDTPGMNDPVPSRTQKTRDYMSRCDVVFFLSRCSQFLDQSDMELLALQLPAKGVKRMVLVAGQLDGVIIDDGYDRDSLARTEQNVRTRLGKRAEIEMEKLAANREAMGDTSIAELLRGLKKPIFASTYAHGYANWDEGRWGGSMRHMHQQLTELAEESWNAYRFTPKDWERLGNFSVLTAAYEQARQDKHALMQARRDDLLPRTQANLERALDKLANAAEQRAALLKTGDINKIEVSTKACKERIAGIDRRLGGIIDTTIERARTEAAELREKLREEAHAAADVQTRTGTKKKVERRIEREPRKFTNLFGLLGRKEHEVEETYYVSYQYIAAADAVECLVNYADESAATLSRTFNQLIRMSALRTDLKRNLVEELSAGSQGFDPSEFRNTLESTLDRLALPELRIDIGDCGTLISSQFSGEVKKNKMDALRQTLRESLRLVHGKLLDAFDLGMKQLCDRLENTRDTLAQKLTAGLQAELDQLKKDFDNKGAEIDQYEKLLVFCRSARKEIEASLAKA